MNNQRIILTGLLALHAQLETLIQLAQQDIEAAANGGSGTPQAEQEPKPTGRRAFFGGSEQPSEAQGPLDIAELGERIHGSSGLR